MQGWQLAGWWFPLHVAWSETTRAFCSSRYATSTHRPSTFSYAGYTSTLYVFSIVFMLEALAKEIAESLGGLFHPMNFSTQLLPVSLFLLEIFQAMPSSGSILCLQNSWHWQRVMLFPTTSPPMALPLSLFDPFSVQMRWILWPFVTSGRSQACRTARDWTQVISHICSHIAIF